MDSVASVPYGIFLDVDSVQTGKIEPGAVNDYASGLPLLDGEVW